MKTPSNVNIYALLEKVRELFEYRREEGKLYWKVSRGSAIAGQEAGTVGGNGYRQVMIDGKLYLVHRLIFLIENEYIPECLDHIDGNPLNNHISNLREASRSENGRNRSKHSNNTSGIVGVCWHKAAGKWNAQCRDRTGKITHLGLFTNKHEAGEVVRKFRLQHHGEFAKEHWITVDKSAIPFLTKLLFK